MFGLSLKTFMMIWKNPLMPRNLILAQTYVASRNIPSYRSKNVELRRVKQLIQISKSWLSTCDNTLCYIPLCNSALSVVYSCQMSVLHVQDGATEDVINRRMNAGFMTISFFCCWHTPSHC